MELTIPKIAVIVATALVARALSKRRKKKDDIDSLYPPEAPKKPKNKSAPSADEQKKSKDDDNLYPPEMQKKARFPDRTSELSIKPPDQSSKNKK